MAKEKATPAAQADQPNTALATQGSTALAEADAYQEYAGSGFENQTSDDYALPFLAILQALSPQVSEDPEKFRQGMLVNTVTGELYEGKKGVCFVPATTQHLFVEWKPRKAGGGFVAVHQPTDEFVARAQKESEARGLPYGQIKVGPGEMDNELLETFYVYGIAIDDNGDSIQAVLAFSSTKIKVYRGWMTKAKTIQIALSDGRRISAPLFAHRYRLTSVSEKNNKGQFYNFNVSYDGENALACRLPPSDPVFQAAVAVKKLIEEGKARAAHETAGAAGSDQTGEGGPSGGGDGDAPAGSRPVF